MAIMSNESKRFIKKYLPTVMESDDPSDILKQLYVLIMEEGFESYETGYNNFGEEAQAVYDDIFYSNFD